MIIAFYKTAFLKLISRHLPSLDQNAAKEKKTWKMAGRVPNKEISSSNWFSGEDWLLYYSSFRNFFEKPPSQTANQKKKPLHSRAIRKIIHSLEPS